MKIHVDRKKRINKLLKGFGIVLCIGVIYYLFVMITDIKVPCFFNLITGLYCPGCGISRMCISIINLDFKAAFSYNPLVFCLLPFFAFEGIYSGIEYVKKGSSYPGKIRKVIWMIVAIVVVVFGILRNINSFSILSP